MKTKEQIEAIVKAKNAYKKAARAISGRKPNVKGENTCPMWDDPKLQEKRAKRKAHLKALAEARKEHFKLQNSRKRNRGFARKSTAKIYQMKKAKLAA